MFAVFMGTKCCVPILRDNIVVSIHHRHGIVCVVNVGIVPNTQQCSWREGLANYPFEDPDIINANIVSEKLGNHLTNNAKMPLKQNVFMAWRTNRDINECDDTHTHTHCHSNAAFIHIMIHILMKDLFGQ